MNYLVSNIQIPLLSPYHSFCIEEEIMSCMTAEFPSVKLTWQALLHALISWNRRRTVQDVYELRTQPSLHLWKVKWYRKTHSHSIPIPQPLICLLCALHSIYKGRTCCPCEDAFLPLGLARNEEIEYLGKVITTALKLAGAILGQCTAEKCISSCIFYQHDG